MRTFFYTTGDHESHVKLGAALRDLPEGEYVVQVKKKRLIRSLSANKYYHAILNIIGMATGHTHEQLHEICKKKFNGDVIHLPKGGMEMVGKTTTDLDTKEFAAYVNRVKQWAQDEFDIIIPEACDIDYKRWIDIENAYEESQSGY